MNKKENVNEALDQLKKLLNIETKELKGYLCIGWDNKGHTTIGLPVVVDSDNSDEANALRKFVEKAKEKGISFSFDSVGAETSNPGKILVLSVN